MSLKSVGKQMGAANAPETTPSTAPESLEKTLFEAKKFHPDPTAIRPRREKKMQGNTRANSCDGIATEKRVTRREMRKTKRLRRLSEPFICLRRINPCLCGGDGGREAPVCRRCRCRCGRSATRSEVRRVRDGRDGRARRELLPFPRVRWDAH